MTGHLDGDNTGRRMEQIRNKLSLLPDSPGCYLMKNKDGVIIYAGKAKVLKNRVRSYFTGSHDAKTQRLVGEICDFEYIITASNMEALILECNLIKKYKPRYNVLLKDDKSFPYIKITHEEHPRLEVTRKVVKDKANTSGLIRTLLRPSRRRSFWTGCFRCASAGLCRQSLSVLSYRTVSRACVQEVSAESNEQMVQEINRFLSGGHEQIKYELMRKMEAAAEELNFERAKEMRDHVIAIDAVMEKQKINSADAKDRDVFGYAVDRGWMCVQILYMRQGKLVERHASFFPYYGEEYEDFMSYVTQYYSDNPALPKEIFLPSPVKESEAAESEDAGESAEAVESAESAEDAEATDRILAEQPDASETSEESKRDEREALQSWLKVKVFIPRRGLKKQMVKMADDNARMALEERFRLMEKDERRTVKAVEGLGQWLGTGAIRRIEAFDNSNIQGTNPVSAMVVFTDGKPDKKGIPQIQNPHRAGSRRLRDDAGGDTPPV